MLAIHSRRRCAGPMQTSFGAGWRPTANTPLEPVTVATLISSWRLNCEHQSRSCSATLSSMEQAPSGAGKTTDARNASSVQVTWRYLID